MEQTSNQPSAGFSSEKYRTAANLGLFLGLYGGLLYFVKAFFSSNSLLSILCSVGNLFFFYLVYVCAKRYRANQLELFPDATLSYHDMRSFVWWLMVCYSLLMAAWVFVDLQWLRPDAISEMLNQSLLLLEESGFPQDSLKLIADSPTPSAAQVAFGYWWCCLIGGFFLSLIYALFFVRRRR